MKETESKEWPLGKRFNNVGKTSAARRYPDIVKVKKHFQTSGHDTLILSTTDDQTFIMPVTMAELIYAPQGNRPELF